MAASELLILLQSKLDEANDILKQCTALQSVGGMTKLKKKIRAEMNFLSKLQKGGATLKKEHVKCSNLVHLKALVDTASSLSDVTAVLQPFPYKDQGRVVVDIVADDDHTWVKVIARKAEALYQISVGQGQFGEKSILDHAVDYTSCAKSHPVFYTTPSVKFVFCSGVPNQLARRLEEFGVAVVGEILSGTTETTNLSENEDSDIENQPTEDQFCSQEFGANKRQSAYQVDTSLTQVLRAASDVSLNLDVTTLLAYVSSLTNGNCWFRFKEKVLSYQAERERNHQVKKLLDSVFEGRELVCCQTAAHDFESIVSTLGGPEEKARARQLMSRVRVVSDCISEKTELLQPSSQIKLRSKIVFGTGDYIQAVTVTANIGFVRSAESQGVKLAVFVHESRALTEAKEKTAEPVPRMEQETSHER